MLGSGIMFKHTIAAIALLSLAACASPPTVAEMYSPVAEDAALITNGSIGGIVADLGIDRNCYSVRVSYRNLVSDRVVSWTFHTSFTKERRPIDAGKHAAVIPVIPGAYMLTALSCEETKGNY